MAAGRALKALLPTAGTGVAIALAQACTGAAFLVLARRLGATDFGYFAAVYAASLTAAAILDFGSTARVTREIARARSASGLRAWILRRTLIQSAAIAPVAIGAVAVASSTSNAVATAVLSGQAVAYTASIGLLAPVRALISPVRAAWFVFAGNLWFLIVCLVAPDGQLMSLCALGAATSWIMTGWLAVHSLRRFHPPAHGLVLERNPWAGARSFGVFGLAVALQGLDVVLIGALSGSAAAAQLSAVARWIQPILLLPTAFATNNYPAMSAAKTDRDAHAIMRSARPVLAISVVAAVVAVVFADRVVEVLLGSEYPDSARVLQLLALTAIPTAASQPLVALLQTRGHERYVSTRTALATGAYLASVSILAHRYGSLAGPSSALITQVVLCIGFWVGARRVRLR